MSLENAPPEVKLAVDLIMLLEENQIAPHIALAALAMVRTDFEKKRSQEENDAKSSAQNE
ncbi:DUF2496 domain-containing protein [Pectobacterium parmentieri]|uniref:DUF2496 domain-containing protein n=1 Tax=Pectobacterium parmentieri TaxID=1905730 RepID=A0A0H3I8W5_PECPM|nr:pleiotropic regulatory protein RsmS [Pectobacterium parmentieri]ACX88981.1 Protein of unknown function DUF2496, YbaM-related protein [Pectobacterium parmentieri WPP163]AFI91310.1 Hypothetical protein W5S_3236 [Pectobacterium parmentieri]AOR57774.1 hypothetical protein A8F97_02455 [Pectobacterium parmentieri]AYH02386.1 DUF2496 domain-containing protein [Pectobacterium parmentieri]AYH06649.1 DUF2496 domain-containing protein [Pectobacterium parmentieri]